MILPRKCWTRTWGSYPKTWGYTRPKELKQSLTLLQNHPFSILDHFWLFFLRNFVKRGKIEEKPCYIFVQFWVTMLKTIMTRPKYFNLYNVSTKSNYIVHIWVSQHKNSKSSNRFATEKLYAVYWYCILKGRKSKFTRNFSVTIKIGIGAKKNVHTNSVFH